MEPADHKTPSFAPNELHARLMENAPRRLGFRGTADTVWSTALRQKLIELLRLPPAIAAPPRLHWRGEAIDRGSHWQRELLVEAEPGADIPVSLLLPKTPGPHPVMLCLQGHTTGRHISLGEAKYPGDEVFLSGGDRDFARQAAARGYAALAIEQRAFGERSDNRPEALRSTAALHRHDDNRSCKHAAMTALLLGRTLLGERVFDLSRICDALPQIPELDRSVIHLLGQSGGGTVGWYACAIEPRIKAAILSACFGRTAQTIGSIDHCCDNYLPDMLTWFDFPDIAGAFFGQKILVVMGESDPVFPRASVLEAETMVRQIMAAQGHSADFDLVVGHSGHRFYADLAWPRFNALLVGAGAAA